MYTKQEPITNTVTHTEWDQCSKTMCRWGEKNVNNNNMTKWWLSVWPLSLSQKKNPKKNTNKKQPEFSVKYSSPKVPSWKKTKFYYMQKNNVKKKKEKDIYTPSKCLHRGLRKVHRKAYLKTHQKNPVHLNTWNWKAACTVQMMLTVKMAWESWKKKKKTLHVVKCHLVNCKQRPTTRCSKNTTAEVTSLYVCSSQHSFWYLYKFEYQKRKIKDSSMHR